VELGLKVHLVNPKWCLGVPGGGGGTSLGTGDEPVPGTVLAVPGSVGPVLGKVVGVPLPPVGEVVVVPPPGEVVVVPPLREVVVVLAALVGDVVVVADTGVPAAQFGLEILSLSRVTAPLRASTRPRIVT
jgi:hypothetical protein